MPILRPFLERGYITLLKLLKLLHGPRIALSEDV